MSSDQLYRRACTLIPGGVNSPVRAFRGVGGTPVFVKRGSGAYLYDHADKAYVDYVCSWGAVITGHAHPEVVAAVGAQLAGGLSFGAPTELESMLAERVSQLMPNLEMVRMVNSGTEATMTALRLARGYSGKSKIIKFNGCYHGHSDCLLVQAGSGGLTLGVPNSAGVPPEVVASTLTCDYNDIDGLRALFERHAGDIAAVIVEPIAGNMNFVRALPEFLQQIQQLCAQEGALVIFDEVMSCFRVALGGAQQLYGLQPDITCLGKVIGGGMPVAALGASAEIMEHLAPNGKVYQAGTLAGNPIAMRAGLATLELISAEVNLHQRLEAYCQRLLAGLSAAFASIDLPMFGDCAGAMFGFYPGRASAVTSLQQPSAAGTEFFRAFYHRMLEHGVYLAPSMFEAGFVSMRHDDQTLEATIAAAQASAQELAQHECTQALRAEAA